MLLASHGRALTLPEMRRGIDVALRYLYERDVPLASSADALASDAGARATLDALSSPGGPVTKFDGGDVTVWAIEQHHQLAATFYRNSIIHFFLDRAISELALRAVQDADDDRETRFWEYVSELRDLLKFDFYFQERDEHRASIAREMERVDPNWTDALHGDSTQVEQLLIRMRPMTSPLMLRPFLEAYRIIADVLIKHPKPDDDATLVKLALGMGRQYQMQGLVSSDEPVSALVFRTALTLARSKGLMDADADTTARRVEFAGQLGEILRHLHDLDRMFDHGPPYLADAPSPASE
jgi:glycerol-3-phosphate O-acyltransferase